MGDDVIKQLVSFNSEFRELLDSKVDHILGMIADMQQQLQAQERTKGKEIRYGGCVAEIQSEQQILIPITDFDEFVIGENNQIENQEGLPDIPHPIAEFESRSEKLELMHEHHCTTVEEADFSTDETTKMQAKKVFDEMLESEMKVLCVTKTVEMKTEIGESEVQRFALSFDSLQRVTCAQYLHIWENENHFSRVFNNRARVRWKEEPPGHLEYCEAYYLKPFNLNTSSSRIPHSSEHDSPRSFSCSIQIIIGKLMHAHMETSRRFVTMFAGNVLVESYLWLLNINGVAVGFDINSLIFEAKHYEKNTLKICDIGFFHRVEGIMLEVELELLMGFDVVLEGKKFADHGEKGLSLFVVGSFIRNNHDFTVRLEDVTSTMNIGNSGFAYDSDKKTLRMNGEVVSWRVALRVFMKCMNLYMAVKMFTLMQFNDAKLKRKSAHILPFHGCCTSFLEFWKCHTSIELVLVALISFSSSVIILCMDGKTYGWRSGGNVRLGMKGNFGKDGGSFLNASIWKELDFVNYDIEIIGYSEVIRISIGVVALSLSNPSDTSNSPPPKVVCFEICVYSTVFNILHPCRALLLWIVEPPDHIVRRRRNCERTKMTLTSTVQDTIEIDSQNESVDFYSTTTPNKFEELNLDLFRRCWEPIEKSLWNANLGKNTTHDVVLVGGPTKIPKVQQFLQDFLVTGGKELYRSIKFEDVATYSATVQTTILCGTGKKGIGVLMFDQLMLKLPPQFRRLSRGDTTHSRGEYYYGNGVGQEGGFDGGKGRRWCDSEVAIQDWIDYGESGGSDVCGSGHVMRLGFGILPTSFKSQDGAMILSCVHVFKELKSRKSHVMSQPHIFGDIFVKIDNIGHYVHVALGLTHLVLVLVEDLLVRIDVEALGYFVVGYNDRSTFAETSFPISTFESWGHDSSRGEYCCENGAWRKGGVGGDEFGY